MCFGLRNDFARDFVQGVTGEVLDAFVGPPERSPRASRVRLTEVLAQVGELGVSVREFRAGEKAGRTRDGEVFDAERDAEDGGVFGRQFHVRSRASESEVKMELPVPVVERTLCGFPSVVVKILRLVAVVREHETTADAVTGRRQTDAPVVEQRQRATVVDDGRTGKFGLCPVVFPFERAFYRFRGAVGGEDGVLASEASALAQLLVRQLLYFVPGVANTPRGVDRDLAPALPLAHHGQQPLSVARLHREARHCRPPEIIGTAHVLFSPERPLEYFGTPLGVKTLKLSPVQHTSMRSFKIGSVFGIPIKLDLTFLLILPVFAWLIGTQVADWVRIMNQIWGLGLAAGPLSSGAMPWYLGAAAAVGLFVGVILHELGHSVVSIHFGFPIDSITLWIFGGIARLTDQPEEWSEELLIAIAGPVVSIILGVLSFVALFAVPTDFQAVRFVLGYLALMNLVLAAFNLLPGFPMDGGRVLRALLARTRPFAQATQTAAEVGKVFAIMLGLFGLLSGNILLIGIAFFIYIGASSEAQQSVLAATFRNVRVQDVMTDAENLHTVSSDTSIADLLEMMFQQRHTGYPVVDDGELVGMITLDDARSVRQVERDAYTVREVMSTDVKTIPADSDAMDALETIQQHNIGRLPVIDADGNVAGIISRTDLMTAFNIINSSGRTEEELAPHEQPS